MTERKFTPPTKFPAEYVDGNGNKVVILGRGICESLPLIGYDCYGDAFSWTEKGETFPKETNLLDLHDINKRIEEPEAKLAKAVEALDEAVYLLAPDEKDMMRKAGVYRVVTALAELKGLGQ